ncbi:integrase [Mesorhizobium loti]|uniref:Integrase n=1 Tax=Rhizobium loti TaxID=381 RepID=A0A101KQM9_RHILI|nr:integrase [Mesorhizobium loti]
MNTLSSMLKDYLAMRRALGFKLDTDGTGLATFVSYVEATGADHITNEIALTWARLPASVQPVQWSRRLGFVRGFARYCSTFDPRTQVPPTDLIPSTRIRRSPHFFNDGDIEQLLCATLALPPVDGLRRWTFHCLFGLLSVSGLRIGEAIALAFEDVDLQEAILTIRSTKFGKSRLVPLHSSTARVLADYMQRRQAFRTAGPTDPVFINERGTPLTYDQSIDTFQRLLKEIGVTNQRDRRRPHLHDLRHRFAMRTLLQWYQNGQDVEQQLPVLSAYLGHTETRDTYWYLSACPELMGLARERLERHWEPRP